MAILQEPISQGHEAPAEKGSDVGEIPQWRLMARRFKQSKLAVAGGIVLLVMYGIALFAPFLAPYDANAVNSDRANASPAKLTWKGGPAVCGVAQTLNKSTFTWEYKTDCNKATPISFFTKGTDYKIFGLIPTTTHLFGVNKSNTIYLWGADDQGRDIFSRTIIGSRVSLTIGLVGVGIGTILGAIIGTISGYFGGLVDNVLQRIIEIILSVPTLPLWAMLAAILPRDMTVTKRYLFITVILSLVGWAGLARQIRGKVMSYAGADYVAAARAAGSGHARVILSHMVPNSISHLVVVTMLAIPTTIIAETSLSFLGIGMLPPAVSWGVLLQDAQKVQAVQQYPWMLIPAVAVVLAVTCYQLLGDGVRDAVDPYG
ncbi:ABC transporter permease [Actinopolymorpha rutila]|uniref:Peptide/nickel transport system permease protein n=1 Tax=Actinopolymorpha rutila TaxID=446787 RepID=A0A852Z5H6_9ACTN|nr:ABC transporter permease [Actinopolymorpha rutila]NYH88597.1 peptide/nickel transport system permease protein [Actinopolymorpha rutila]